MTDWNHSKASEDLRKAMRSAIPVEDPQHVAERRNRLVDVIEKEVAQVPLRAATRERRRVTLRVVFAAAAVFVIGIASTQLLRLGTAPTAQLPDRSENTEPTGKDGQQVEFEGAQLSLQPSRGNSMVQALRVGSTVSLSGTEVAELTLPAGTTMQLSARGKLQLLEAKSLAQTVLLTQGRLVVDVREGQAQTRRVRVKTPHASVEVKGTRFSVDVDRPESGSPEGTAVAVQRGEVLVRFDGGTLRLHPGQVWRSEVVGALSVRDDSENAGAAESETAFGPIVAEGALGETAPRASVRPRSPSPQAKTSVDPADTESTLALQNSLLEHAVWLDQQGRVRQAEAVLSRLLRSYPRSPLRATVQAEQTRLRKKLDSAP